MNAIASTNCPFDTSHCTLDAVSVNTFVVPSIEGSNSWFPWVVVWFPARNASTPALCIDAIISALIAVDPGRRSSTRWLRRRRLLPSPP